VETGPLGHGDSVQLVKLLCIATRLVRESGARSRLSCFEPTLISEPLNRHPR